MAVHHASAGELIDIPRVGKTIKRAQSTPLYKTQHLEVLRVVLLAEKSGFWSLCCAAVPLVIATIKGCLRLRALACELTPSHGIGEPRRSEPA